MAYVAYSRIRHAAHYGHNDPRRGHDLEMWTYAQPERLPVPPGVPFNADFHHGSSGSGVQIWVYVRIAPISDGTCERCGDATTNSPEKP